MKLPFINLNGDLPSVEELREFGLIFDERTQGLVTVSEDRKIVPLDLGGVVDISGYNGHGKHIEHNIASIPENVRLGQLFTLEDVISHIYFSKLPRADTSGIPDLPSTQSITLSESSETSTVHLLSRLVSSGETELVVVVDTDGLYKSKTFRLTMSMNDKPTREISVSLLQSDFISNTETVPAEVTPSADLLDTFSEYRHLKSTSLSAGLNALSYRNVLDTRHVDENGDAVPFLNLFITGTSVVITPDPVQQFTLKPQFTW